MLLRSKDAEFASHHGWLGPFLSLFNIPCALPVVFLAILSLFTVVHPITVMPLTSAVVPLPSVVIPPPICRGGHHLSSVNSDPPLLQRCPYIPLPSTVMPLLSPLLQ